MFQRILVVRLQVPFVTNNAHVNVRSVYNEWNLIDTSEFTMQVKQVKQLRLYLQCYYRQ